MPKTSRKDKEDRFVEEYLVDLNATQAYLRSHPGVAENTSRTEASRLLAKPDIQKKIADMKAARAKRTRVTQDRVVRELARIAFLDPRNAFTDEGDLVSPRELPPAVARAVKGIDVKVLFAGRGDGREEIGVVKKIRFDSKVRALEVLLQHVKEENKKAADSQPVTFVDLVKKASEGKS